MKIHLLGSDLGACTEWTARLERRGAQVLTGNPGADTSNIALLRPDPDNAIEQVRELRRRSPLAALLVLIDADLPLRLRLLEEGADDLAAPGTAAEDVIARLSTLAALGPAAAPWTEVGELRLGPSRVAVFLNERRFDLGEQAYRVLCRLASSAPESASREALMEAGWGGPIDDNRLDALIRRLRITLRRAGSPRIDTVRGLGYRLLA